MDPGSGTTGYGIIVSEPRHMELVLIDIVHTEKYDDHFDRLSRIFHHINDLIREYRPHEIAVEAPFYGKNAQSMLKLGRSSPSG